MSVLQEMIEGMSRLLSVMADEEAEMETTSPDSASQVPIANATRTYHGIVLHVCAVLRTVSLACPPSILQTATQLLLEGLPVPQLERLQRSRLVREQGAMALQAVVDAHRDGTHCTTRERTTTQNNQKDETAQEEREDNQTLCHCFIRNLSKDLPMDSFTLP